MNVIAEANFLAIDFAIILDLPFYTERKHFFCDVFCMDQRFLSVIVGYFMWVLVK